MDVRREFPPKNPPYIPKHETVFTPMARARYNRVYESHFIWFGMMLRTQVSHWLQCIHRGEFQCAFAIPGDRLADCRGALATLTTTDIALYFLKLSAKRPDMGCLNLWARKYFSEPDLGPEETSFLPQVFSLLQIDEARRRIYHKNDKNDKNDKNPRAAYRNLERAISVY